MIPLFIGTYTRPAPHLGATNGAGIYRTWFDPESGRFDELRLTPGIENCSYLCVSADRSTLHAIWEVIEWPHGLVSSYHIDGVDLSFLGTQSSKGRLPCYVTETPDLSAAFVANYLDGRVARYPVRRDGSLAEAVAVHQHRGSGPNEARQDAAHAHCVVVDPLARYAFSADLGIDAIVGYRVDDDALDPHSRLDVAPGSGPRHLVFHPRRPFAYATCELDSTVVALDYDAEAGELSVVGRHRLLPADFTGESHAADLHLHPTAEVLYCSNRGHDSISVFAIGAAGDVELVDTRSTEGRTPRNFAVSPDGRMLLVGNQDSDTVVVIEVGADGRLGDTVATHAVPTPASLEFGA